MRATRNAPGNVEALDIRRKEIVHAATTDLDLSVWQSSPPASPRACSPARSPSAGLRRVDTPTTIHACRLVPSGLLRIVDEPSDCRRHERHLSWNVQGPAGPQGPAGAQGHARGPAARPGHRDQPARQGQPGPAGPAGPPGSGLSSLDDLDGLACNGGAGTVDLTYDGAGQRDPDVRHRRRRWRRGGDERERADDRCHRSSDERVRRDRQHRHGGGRSLRLEARLPLGGRDERRRARHRSRRHVARRGRLLPVRRRRLRGRSRRRTRATRRASPRRAAAWASATPTGNLVDSVGWGTATNAFVEGTVAAAPATTEAPGTSIGRIPDGDDTNDNAADFVLDDSPTPKGSNG